MAKESPEAATPSNVTPAHVLGEVAWLMAQSPLHQAMPLAALSWLVIPALSSRQFFLFRDAERPVGVAFWAFCSAEAEAKLEAGALEEATRLKLEDWTSGDRLWLVDLVAPFANAENRHVELMIADLLAGPLKGRHLNMHRLDPSTVTRSKVTLGPETLDELKAAIDRAASAGP